MVVLGGSSVQNALRMCSCGQEVAGRTHGDEGALLFKIKAEEGYWKGERRSDDTVHLLCASNHARHVHPLVISSTFIERLPGTPGVRDTTVNKTASAFKQLIVSLRKQVNKQAKAVQEAMAGDPDVRSRGEMLVGPDLWAWDASPASTPLLS